MSIKGPRAALHVDWTGSVKSGPQDSIYFFKSTQYIRWNVEKECLEDGYPQDISAGWPGLLEARPGGVLHGAMHVPDWGNRIFFFFEGDSDLVTWNVDDHVLMEPRVAASTILPSVLTSDGRFTPLYVDAGDSRKVYVFRGDAYSRFTVRQGEMPQAEDDGYPRKIGDGWTDGLTVAPSCATSVHWTGRSAAISRRKIYFFLGDLYTRWDVTSHTRNYRLDVPAGWKGWPDFD